MKENRMYDTSRWLVALAAVVIPLSIIIMVSGFSYNYTGRQWTRYLLLAALIAWVLSLAAGVINLIGFSTAEPPDLGQEKPAGGFGEEKAPAEGMLEEAVESTGKQSSQKMGASLLVAQAAFFLGGAFVYVAFCCWMILPQIAL
ncbi:MAG: hypothetical protein ACOC78_03535 [Actinomycetota bacterium]